ncbi:hypothetical protein LCGC14_0010620 [marine sediment metagenome]|uniref:Uncharacterized protein n=1 Tax=marine sediment metagenome TaxID=412755 RepID=A0A0F9Z331_9ZZZZ
MPIILKVNMGNKKNMKITASSFDLIRYNAALIYRRE